MTATDYPERVRRTFWSKVAVRSADECWPWRLSIGNHGYGQVGWGEPDGKHRMVSGEDRMSTEGEPMNDPTAALVAAIQAQPTVDAKVKLLNEARRALHEVSPFACHPVDLVEWVPVDSVRANDYNPNSVAPPEMELLRVSIDADGYTQPIVANDEDGDMVVVDGFHRHRVGRECEDVAVTLHGYLPVVQIRAEASDRGDRIASTIRHNRARGKHAVVKMTDIVLELKRRNWSDAKIGKQLGMDDDEVLRLSQIGGLADSFADRSFSMAWEVDDDDDDLAVD